MPAEKNRRKPGKSAFLLGGAGMDGIMADRALQFGFEGLAAVDGNALGKRVLNRQRQAEADVGKYQAEAFAGDCWKSILARESSFLIPSYCRQCFAFQGWSSF